ncbi:MAG: hypothetical protein JNL01_03405 [Bdellovibrionales bacterium]|nr:hypothetical protein [Bdellovibrionales bacterium]
MKKTWFVLICTVFLALGSRFMARECVLGTAYGQSNFARSSLGFWSKVSPRFFSSHSGFTCPKQISVQDCQKAHVKLVDALLEGKPLSETLIQIRDGQAGIFIYGTKKELGLVFVGFSGDKNRETQTLGINLDLKKFGTYLVLGKPSSEKSSKFMAELRKDGKFPTGQYSLRIFGKKDFKDPLAIKKFVLTQDSIVQ